MLNRALYLRVGSLMSAGRFDDATAALVELQNQTGGREGSDIIFDLLNRLDADFGAAESSGDADRMRTLAQNRAKLSGFLVGRARGNNDPKLRARLYSYSVYDAESKRRAGTLAKDEKQLREALDAFRRLLTPDMLALYRQESAENPKIDPNYPAPNVLLGVGLASFELRDYKAAQENLGRLLVDKKLGSADLPKVDEKTNETTYVDNEPYWEANYKLLRSNVELYKQNKDDPKAKEAFENTKAYLKQLYIRGDVGGEKWKDEFEALRKEIVPDFVPDFVPATGATPEPGAAPDAGPASE